MEYLERTLNIKIKLEEWEGQKSLPVFMPARYAFKKALLAGSSVIFMYVKNKDFFVRQDLLTHISIVQELAGLPVVVVLQAVANNERQFLISNGVPFVVDKKQIYLPFLGAFLQEHYNFKPQIKESLLPFAQLLLFYIIYRQIADGTEAYFVASEAAKELDIAPMNLSRATGQLESLHLITAEINGRKKYLYPVAAGEALFNLVKPHLINPVQRRIAISEKSGFDETDQLLSGEYALAENSMLAYPRLKSFAVYKKAGYQKYAAEALDYSTVYEPYAELEIWKYNPRKLAVKNYVDPLSLYACFINEEDERIESCLEVVLSNLWKGKVYSE